ncbi:ABC transporter permease [Mesorhizobium shangrilense]|uniref:ABC transporter permease n=1 Tax=Mesorhizobium shangrilense TaxID=460060 RepID=A0ABV2DGN1_9HYPH
MTAVAVRRFVSRQQNLLVPIVFCILVFLWQQTLLFEPFSYFEWSSIVTNAGPLAFAAMGLTIVFILRGLDMSCGAVVALVNVVVVLNATDSFTGQVLLCIGGIAVGAIAGALNGYLVAVLRIQSVVATLATMFMIMGLNLLLMPSPGGTVPSGLVSVFTGDLIVNTVPGSAAVILAGLLVWFFAKSSRFGTALYATGSDEAAAFANGIHTQRTKFMGYVLAGAFYGVAGIFLAALTNTGDPLIGSGMLLRIFTAAVLGGVALGGGKGDCVGAVFAATSLMIISSALLNLGVVSDWTSIVEAGLLIAAVIGGSIGQRHSLYSSLSELVSRSPRVARGRSVTISPSRPIPELQTGGLRSWLRRNEVDVRCWLPPWVLLALVYASLLIVVGASSFSLNYLNSLLVLTVFLAVLAIGQGAVLMTGGLDLSVPYTLTFTGVFVATMTNGSDVVALWAIPAAIGIGALVGLFNGLLISVLGIPAIIVTLAMNGVMQSAGLLYSGGFAQGQAPGIAVSLFEGRVLGLAPASWLLLLLTFVATWLLNYSVFGRQIVLVGSNPRVAHLSGVAVKRSVTFVYVLSGVCAALAGVLLLGFSRHATLNMGAPFLLPSIAAVLIGGTLASGGRGHYFGILGGCLMLVALGTLVTGANLPVALRDIIFGAVMLVAVVIGRGRS